MENLKIYQKLYDFALYIFPIIDRFPKFEKFALSSQIKNCILDIGKLIIRTNKSKNKRASMYEIDIKIEEIKFLLRFAHDKKYLSNKSYEYSFKKVLEIGRLLGGWLKSLG